MKTIMLKLIGVTALLAAFTVSAKQVEVGAVSPTLEWRRDVETTSALTLQIRSLPESPPLAIACIQEIDISRVCFEEYKVSSDAKSVTSRIFLLVNDTNPLNSFNTYNHTARHVLRFESGDFRGKAIPAIVSGLIQSSGTVATSSLAAEGWTAFGVKVEIYKSTTDSIDTALLIGGTSAVSEGCSSTAPNTVELYEPCRNVFSNDVPVSIPVLLIENSFYFVVVTTSCDAQGNLSGCYGTQFAFNLDDKNAAGIATVMTDFSVSVADEAARQDSVDALLNSNHLLMKEVCTLTRFRSQACQDLQ